MGFKIRTFHDVLERMADWVTGHTTQLTNFHVGSSLRTLLEGVAVELEALYFEMYKGFNYAISNAIFDSFDFQKNPATYASGTITIRFKGSLTQEVTIPKGTKFTTTPTRGTIKTFLSTREVVCGIGVEQVQVPIQCTEPGPIGNVSAMAIRVISRPLPFVDAVYNEESFTTGYPEESSEERKKRFILYIQTLARGTLSAVHYGCISVPGVTGAYLEEEIGVVYAYVHDSDGNLPAVLRENVIRNLKDYRAAGIEVFVNPIERTLVDIHVDIYLSSTIRPEQISRYEALVRNSLVEYLNSFGVSKPLLRADIIRRLMSVSGTAIINVVTDLEEDVHINTMELIRPGTITVTGHIA